MTTNALILYLFIQPISFVIVFAVAQSISFICEIDIDLLMLAYKLVSQNWNAIVQSAKKSIWFMI